jgi:predicted transcriptional regulator of viral defense system
MTDATNVEHRMGAEGSARSGDGLGEAGDRLIADLAERQHGVVGRRQLLAAGIGRGAIGTRLAAGRLHRLHRGVYAVGHRALTTRGRWMAAVLAAAPGAVLSHRSAASLWGIRRAAAATIEVTAADRRRARSGLRIHESPLPFDEITTRDRVPVTILPRTLLDLATCLDRPALERALEQAEATRITDSLSIDDLLERYTGRAGTSALRAILAAGRLGAGITRSELEDRFLAFLAAHELPRPAVNAGVWASGRWFECDCVWHSARLIVELDGRESHATTAAFERDRTRDRALTAAGWRVIRGTWRQLEDEAPILASALRSLLGGVIPKRA